MLRLLYHRKIGLSSAFFENSRISSEFFKIFYFVNLNSLNILLKFYVFCSLAGVILLFYKIIFVDLNAI